MSDNKTVKGLVWGGTFSILSQLVGLLIGIVLARLLTPADYGLVGMLAIFSAIATLLQESGFVFVLTNKKDVTQEEYSTVFWFNISVSAIIYCILFIFAPLIADFFDEPRLVSLSRVVFLSFFISSFGVVQSAHLYKNLKVKEKGILTIISQVLSGIIGIVMALNGMSYWGIAIQTLSATIITTSLLWYYSPFRPSLTFKLDIVKKILPDGIRFAFPNLFSTISENVYSVILGRFFTVSDVGVYNQASKLNKYGYSIVLNIFRSVSQPSLVLVKDDKQKILSSFRKLFRLSAFLNIPIMMVISLVSSELVIILFTWKWSSVGIILRILCLGGVFINLTTMFSYVIMSLGKSSIYMNMGVFLSLLKIIVVLASIKGGVIWLAILSSFSDLLGFIIYYIVVNREISYSVKLILSDISPILLISSALYFSIYFATLPITNLICLLLVRVVSFGVGYVLLAVLLRLETYQEIKVVISNKLKKLK